MYRLIVWTDNGYDTLKQADTAENLFRALLNDDITGVPGRVNLTIQRKTNGAWYDVAVDEALDDNVEQQTHMHVDNGGS